MLHALLPALPARWWDSHSWQCLDDFPGIENIDPRSGRSGTKRISRFPGAGEVVKHVIINNIILNLGGQLVGTGQRVPDLAKRAVGYMRCQAGRAATMKRLARE